MIEAYLGEKVVLRLSCSSSPRVTAGYGAFTALWDVACG